MKRDRVNSVLKGTQLDIMLDQGQIVINAPPQVLDRVDEYFQLIYDNEPYMVGSAKKIKQIEAETPDKNEFKRASQKFINIFREWLFGTRIQKYLTHIGHQ